MEIRDRLRNAATGALSCVGLLVGLVACQASENAWSRGAAPHAQAASKTRVFAMKGPTLREPRGQLADECAQRRLALARKVGGPCVIWVSSAPNNNLSRFFQERRLLLPLGRRGRGCRAGAARRCLRRARR